MEGSVEFTDGKLGNPGVSHRGDHMSGRRRRDQAHPLEDTLTTVVHLLLTSCSAAQLPAEPMHTLIDHIAPRSSTAPVMVLFGGDPHRRDEVLRHLSTLGDLGAYGALSEEEGYALLEQHKDRVKLVLIGGRYTAGQRVRIKSWCRERFPSMAFTEPGVDHAYNHELTKAAVKRILGL